ncbi:Uma2 family endonuclease [Pseudonocardia sp. KRD-169]|uniref:Uma2 family endonuclease n=1 Tax=Pseudonocardia abyssalis TaxID=2792008 RepID=A0ABS6UKR7_9PSEU|nr:Uma2 family endonuclease [Pseudonocardia abyssalis]MBW0132848.1 Uma2 family endonuclease [Pseudonocardia abyssalis]
MLPRSEPQPDVLVARRARDRYAAAHPSAEGTLLVTEMAGSSLHTDRAIERPIYARQDIVEVWTADLAAEVVHEHTDPADGDCRSVRTAGRGAELPVAAPAVDDVLG